MTMLCASSSTWMMPLLLLHLLVCFHQSSSGPTIPPMHEFNILVDMLGKIVENCPENCSLGPNTSQSCQCFNVNVSQEECSFPRYFINGLNSLLTGIFDFDNKNTITDLNLTLPIQLPFQKSVSFCSSSVKTKALVSPKCLYKKLQFLKEQINSDRNIVAQQSLPTVVCEVVQ